ncbi:MAG: hypothetical protein HOE90_22245 [Bacteriovoracaceae bacterium]|nr:hypothetical protein [Bacteriovoracaceae bacterium]
MSGFSKKLQIIVWFIGAAIFALLVFLPSLGLHAFWNILIPVAPALLVIAPGLWRNICPMGSTTLLPRHMGYSKKNKISEKTSTIFNLIGLVLLFSMVPLRHLILDMSGQATAISILTLTLAGVILGSVFEWKSGWCSGMCPIHQVEKIYGQSSVFQLKNDHCGSCVNCVSPCPDSTTPGIIQIQNTPRIKKYTDLVMRGGFVGFVWGWFQVPNFHAAITTTEIFQAYALPILGMSVSLFIFLVFREILGQKNREYTFRLFPAMAVMVYYWYRIPMLFGFGMFPGDGMLVDLTHTLPAWTMAFTQILTSAGFLWLMVLKDLPTRSWSLRPKSTELGSFPTFSR